MHRVLETHRHPKIPKLRLERRSSSRYWQARVYADGRIHQKSTEHPELRSALRIAESWYRDLLGSTRALSPLAGAQDTMGQLFQQYKATLPTPGKRAQAAMRWGPIRQFWQVIRHADVTTRSFHEFYRWRRARTPAPSNSTLHKDCCLVRQILRYACEQGLRDSMPLVPRFGSIGRNPRPWLTQDEWETVWGLAMERVDAATNPRTKRQRQDLLDFIVFMVESMLRVNELRALTVGRCQPRGQAPNDYLLLDVMGKTGHREAVAGGFAPEIYKRRAEGLKPSDKLFAHSQRDGFTELLLAANLRVDQFAVKRNLKSLRSTAISFALLRGIPVDVVARNAGTSIQQVSGFYAARLTPSMHAGVLGLGQLIAPKP